MFGRGTDDSRGSPEVTGPAQPIDLDEFRAAMRASGIEEIVVPMLTLFAQEAPKGVAALASALAAHDLDAVGRAAHSLKSSAGNVRAKALAELLLQLESAAERGDAQASASLFESVVSAYDATRAQLAEMGISG